MPCRPLGVSLFEIENCVLDERKNGQTPHEDGHKCPIERAKLIGEPEI